MLRQRCRQALAGTVYGQIRARDDMIRQMVREWGRGCFLQTTVSVAAVRQGRADCRKGRAEMACEEEGFAAGVDI